MKKITDGTLARTLVLALALLNQLLAVLGKGTINIAEDDIYQVVSILFTIGAAVMAWWKNNSFTQAAIAADEFMNIINSAETTIEIEENETDTDEQTRSGTETDVE